MRSNFEKVQQFHRASDVENPDYPQLPTYERQMLREKLIEEEFWELKQAFSEGDVVAYADAVADLLYVVYGTADEAGIDADAVFAEVHRSNMSKVGADGKVLKRADGKILKPDTYSPPDVESVLDAQVEIR
jgi:predicted HAD superfamily Cof-like phosphohydrolase